MLFCFLRGRICVIMRHAQDLETERLWDYSLAHGLVRKTRARGSSGAPSSKRWDADFSHVGIFKVVVVVLISKGCDSFIF